MTECQNVYMIEVTLVMEDGRCHVEHYIFPL